MRGRARATRGRVASTALAVCSGVALTLLSALSARAEPIAIDIQVAHEPGDGFNDPVLGAQRLAAMRTAADLFGHFFTASHPGETVPVQVEMVPALVDRAAETRVTRPRCRRRSVTSPSSGRSGSTARRRISTPASMA